MAAKTAGRYAGGCFVNGDDFRADCRSVYERTFGRCFAVRIAVGSASTWRDLSVCTGSGPRDSFIYCRCIWRQIFTETGFVDGPVEIQFRLFNAGAGGLFRPPIAADRGLFPVDGHYFPGTGDLLLRFNPQTSARENFACWRYCAGAGHDRYWYLAYSTWPSADGCGPCPANTQLAKGAYPAGTGTAATAKQWTQYRD